MRIPIAENVCAKYQFPGSEKLKPKIYLYEPLNVGAL